jgi:hypothetical protein
VETYTPGTIWLVLSGEITGEDDLDAVLDVQLGLKRLPPGQAVFITQLALGYSGKESMKTAGISGNQTYLKRLILHKLTREINGSE